MNKLVSNIGTTKGDEPSRKVARLLREMYNGDDGWLLPSEWGKGGNFDCAPASHALFTDLAPILPNSTKLAVGWVSFGGGRHGWHYWVEASGMVCIDPSGGQVSVEPIEDLYKTLQPKKVRKFAIRKLINIYSKGKHLPLFDPQRDADKLRDRAVLLRARLTRHDRLRAA